MHLGPKVTLRLLDIAAVLLSTIVEVVRRLVSVRSELRVRQEPGRGPGRIDPSGEEVPHEAPAASNRC